MVLGILAGVWALPAGAFGDSSHALSRMHAQDLPTPDQVVDATKNPDLAGTDLNFCGQFANGKFPNCEFINTQPINLDYGPPTIVGDSLYNCSAADYAQTSVSFSEDRTESTNVSETAAVRTTLDFLDLEKETVDFHTTVSEAQSVGVTMTPTNAVAVPPLWKGWNEAEVYSANVTGDAYVTDGIHVIKVTGIDLSFPGYMPPGVGASANVKYIGYRTPMSSQEIAQICGKVQSGSDTGSTGLGATGPTAPMQFKVTLCRRGRRHRCTARSVTGTPPPRTRRAAVRLTRHGRTYGTGTMTGHRIRLNTRKTVRAGIYRLTIKQKTLRTITTIGIG